MCLLACLIVAPQRGYDEPAILSYAISSFCPTSADGLHLVNLWTAAVPAFRESGDWPRQGLRTRQDRRSRPARRNLERAMAVAVVPRCFRQRQSAAGP